MEEQKRWANQLRQAGWTAIADRVEAGQKPTSALFSEMTSTWCIKKELKNMGKENKEFAEWWTTEGREKYSELNMSERDGMFRKGFVEAVMWKNKQNIEIKQKLTFFEERIKNLEEIYFQGRKPNTKKGKALRRKLKKLTEKDKTFSPPSMKDEEDK